MKITVLSENTSVSESIGAEHGLSLHIETDNHNILFDMGQTELFSENAEKLGVDLSQVDIAVLSHGHYDHGGGLKKFLTINKKAPVYIRRSAFEPHFNGSEKYIGLDSSLINEERLIFTEDYFEIASGMALYSCNDRPKKTDLGSFGLKKRINGQLCPDDFRHEQYLMVNEKDRKILISGCSHKGILNIADWFSPDILIGGFHFSKLPLDNTLKHYAKYLNNFDTDFYTCHCTGIEQFEYMKKYMNRLFFLHSGQEILL